MEQEAGAAALSSKDAEPLDGREQDDLKDALTVTLSMESAH